MILLCTYTIHIVLYYIGRCMISWRIKQHYCYVVFLLYCHRRLKYLNMVLYRYYSYTAVRFLLSTHLMARIVHIDIPTYLKVKISNKQLNQIDWEINFYNSIHKHFFFWYYILYIIVHLYMIFSMQIYIFILRNKCNLSNIIHLIYSQLLYTVVCVDTSSTTFTLFQFVRDRY